MPINPNQVVTIQYTVTDGEENIVDSTREGQPFSFLSAPPISPPEMVTDNRARVAVEREAQQPDFKRAVIQRTQ